MKKNLRNLNKKKPTVKKSKKTKAKKKVVKAKKKPAKVKLSSNAKKGIRKLQTQLKKIPDGASGRGGIDIIKGGKKKMLHFATKGELESILKNAQNGKYQIVM